MLRSVQLKPLAGPGAEPLEDRWRRIVVRLARSVLLAGGCLLAFSAAARASTIEVTTTADPAGAGSCPASPCSLRQAVAFAGEGDTISLGGSSGSPAVYALTQGVPVVVGKSLTIEGNGTDATTLDGSANRSGGGQPLQRILKVTAGSLDLTGLTLTGGNDEEDEGFAGCGGACETLKAHGGGALYNAATTKIDDVVFRANGEAPVGGAIGNAGTLDLTNVSFEGDQAAFGGGLYSRAGTVTANAVTFAEDGTIGFGGGGAFINGGSALFENTTVVGSGASSSRGGGIENRDGMLTLRNDTLSGNLRGSLQTDEGATTTVQNTILASGFADGIDFDCVAEGQATSASTTTAKAITIDLGNNIDQDNACQLDAAGDLAGVDPRLASLADNGGTTRTQALLAGSPAIDAANDGACPATDQRGIGRPQGTHCDIGAFEVLSPPSVSSPASSPISGRSSKPSSDFTFGKLKLHRNGVAASITVNTPSGGVLLFSGKGVKTESITATGPGSQMLPVIPLAAVKKKLKRQSKVRLTIEVTFTATGGTASSQSKPIILRGLKRTR